MASSGEGGSLTSSVELYEGGLSSSSGRVSKEEEYLRSTDIEKIWCLVYGYLVFISFFLGSSTRRNESNSKRQCKAFFKRYEGIGRGNQANIF